MRRPRIRPRAILGFAALALLLVVSACVTGSGQDPTPSPRPLPTDTPTPTQVPTSTPDRQVFRRPTPQPSSQPASPPASTPTTEPNAEPTATPISAPTLEPQLRALLLEIERRVVEERGLSDTAASERRIVTKDELLQILKERRAEDEDAKEDEITQALLVTVGLLEEGDDLAQLRLELSADQIAGFFDLESGELNIVSDADSFRALEEWTYAHEYAHALQQGTFDLKATREALEDDSEASAAFTALVEGDATLVATRYTIEFLNLRDLQVQASESSGDSLEEAPLVLREGLLFPYTAGLQFVLALFLQGGWAAVDAAYGDPPKSTEQILHPDKYLAREAPLTVSLPEIAPALGEGWEQAKVESFGEFDLAILLRTHLSESAARLGADGWGGDRYAFLRNGADAVFVDLIRWDTPGDATEFFEAYVDWLERQDADLAASDAAIDATTPGRRHVVRLAGSETLVVIATDPTLPGRILPLFPGF